MQQSNLTEIWHNLLHAYLVTKIFCKFEIWRAVLCWKLHRNIFSKTFKMTNFKARDVQYLVLPSYFLTEENDALWCNMPCNMPHYIDIWIQREPEPELKKKTVTQNSRLLALVDSRCHFFSLYFFSSRSNFSKMWQ